MDVFRFIATGEVAEWLKAHAWKACKGAIFSWVRIPFSPPPNKPVFKGLIRFFLAILLKINQQFL